MPPTSPDALASVSTTTGVGRTAGDAQIRWLVDRAHISDLLVEFARALDQRDWDAYAATYAPRRGAVPGPMIRIEGPEKIREMTSTRGPGSYPGTWHLSANHAITIDGDTASTRSYMIGVHMLSDDTADHADGAGWYECRLRRTDVGWRFTEVRLQEVWHAGKPLPHARPPE